MKLRTLTALMAISGSTVLSSQAALPVVDPASPEAPVEKATADSAKKQIEEATQAYDNKYRAFMKQVHAEKNRQKKMKMFRTGHPSSAEAVNLILKLAKKDPKAEGIEKGLVWGAVKSSNSMRRKEARDLLLAHYSDSASLGQVVSMYGKMRRGGEVELREILKKAGDEKVRQGATYYLAEKLMKSERTKKEGISMMKKLIATPGLDKANPKLIAQAKAKIRAAETFGIGCTAPDIVGTDHEGKEFKLSDYRGKVVLLDFWGIW